jgi:cytidylate kinase
MNKNELNSKKKNKLIIIGSALGVNRFFITNKFIEKINAKTIHTGTFIHNLIKQFSLNEFEDLTLKEYNRIIEPSIVKSIQDHLEHNNVILDTHFYYLIPALSMESLSKLKNYVDEIILVLVEEDVLNIFKRNNPSSNWMLKNVRNIESDVIMNRNYIEFYENVIKEFTKVRKIKVNLSKETSSNINKFIEEIKYE